MDSSRRGALGDGLRPLAEMATADYRPGFLAAIDIALDLKPERRPQSIAEWRAALLTDIPTTTPPSLSPASIASAADARPAASAEMADAEARTSDRDNAASASSAAIAPPRRGPIIAALALLALVSVGAAAWWRDGGTPPSPPGPEARAEAAWRPLAEGSDAAAIERFLVAHGSTRVATAARSRLTALRDEARRNEEARAAAGRAKAEAEARAARQRQKDADWQTCRDAPVAARATSCAAVIQSNDTPARRAAALHLVGVAERNGGRYDEAIARFTESLALVPGDAQVLNDRGIAHFLKGGAADRDAAMQDYDRAIQADPRHAEALNNRAWSLFQAGRAAEALTDANRSIEAAPTNGYAYDTRGQILEALGRKDEAVRDFKRALSLDPSQEASRAGLARLGAAGP